MSQPIHTTRIETKPAKRLGRNKHDPFVKRLSTHDDECILNGNRNGLWQIPLEILRDGWSDGPPGKKREKILCFSLIRPPMVQVSVNLCICTSDEDLAFTASEHKETERVGERWGREKVTRPHVEANP